MSAYLAIIVLPTLVLLGLGLQSLRQRYEAMDALTEKYARISMEHLADTFEQRVRELAADALHDPDLAGVLPLVARSAGPENQRAIRVIVARVAGRHPVAARLILQQGGTVRFPSAMWVVPERADDLFSVADPRSRALFEAARGEEDRAVAGRGDFEHAAAAYHRCAELAVPKRLRAIALAGAARCYWSAGQWPAVAGAWREVAEQYGDEYDLSNRPYGLVAGLQLCALRPPAGAPTTWDNSSALKEDLAAGRWEVSAEDAAYWWALLGEIERRPRDANGPSPARTQALPGMTGPFLDHLRLAASVARGFVPPGTLAVGDVREAALPLDDHLAHPFLYASLGSAAGASGGVTAGLVIDPGWARDLLRSMALRSGVPASQLVAARSAAVQGQQARGRIVELRGAFTGWALRSSEGGAAADAGHRDLFVFGGVTTLVLGVLLLGVALVVRDTARQRELAELRADLVSGVSHQLRTPLALIRLYSEMLTDYPDTSEDDRLERLHVITSESRRLTNLIDHVLDFSRIERSEKPYVLERGDLAAAVRPVAEIYAQSLRRRGFTVEVDIGEALPAVRFDPGAVADGVVNLVDNAEKYAGDGKYVRIRLAARAPEVVVIEVADHGPGIPEAQRERLFQAFYRGPHRKEKGGYGLGLFLVRSLMEGHGGRVEVENQPDRGSVFRLVFPVDRSVDP